MEMSSPDTDYGLTTLQEIESGLSHLNLLHLCASDSHVDLLAFLATAQVNGTDFLPIAWYPSYFLGKGGFALLNQLPIKAELSYAFKRLGKNSQAPDEETKDFSSSITELTILRHRPISRHPNIIKLEGICWEVTAGEGRILPVLVFEKATYGDLFHFRDTEEGRKLTVEQKVSLCAQILDSLYTLHASRIIHGDIKPFNILIFNNEKGALIAKLADFGHSIVAQDKSDMFRLPRSEPWTAPEWHHRHHSYTQARTMDIYSFALFCLWLLMDHSFTSSDSKAALLAIQDHKKSGRLVHEACNIIDTLDAAHSLKQGLKSLFQLTLTRESRKSIRSIGQLMPYLDPDSKNKWVKAYGAKLNRELHHVEFNISHDLYALLFTNYVVRKVIVENLQLKAKSSPCMTCKENAAFQLAFCYSVGFGIRIDHEMAQYWVDKGKRELQDLDEEKDEVSDFGFYTNEKVKDLSLDGMMIMDHVSEYRRPEYDINTVIDSYRGEIVDLGRAFENDSLVTATLRATLANILVGLGHLQEAEVLYRELVDFCLASDQHGARHSFTLGCRTHLGHILQEQGRMKEADQILRDVLAIRKNLFGCDHHETLESGTALASLLFWTKELDEARELLEYVVGARQRVLGADHIKTLLTITNLACVYREQALYSEAQQLDEQVLAVKQRILGDEAHETINSMANLALTFSGQGLRERAEKLELEVLDKRRRYLGENSPATMVAKTNLATTYFNQSRLDEAERLELEVLQGRQQVFGKSHWLTLQSMDNLLNTYIEQGRMEACEHNMTLLLEASLAKAEPDPRLQPSILEKATRLCSLYKESGRLQSLSKLEAKMDMLQRQSTT